MYLALAEDGFEKDFARRGLLLGDTDPYASRFVCFCFLPVCCFVLLLFYLNVGGRQDDLQAEEIYKESALTTVLFVLRNMYEVYLALDDFRERAWTSTQRERGRRAPIHGLFGRLGCRDNSKNTKKCCGLVTLQMTV